MFQITVRTFLRAGKLYITDRRGPSTNVSYFHYRECCCCCCRCRCCCCCCCCCSRSRSRSRSCSCCFVDSTCHQPVMAASELAAMRNLATCELDKRRHLVTDVRNSKPYLGQEVKVCDKYLGQRHIKSRGQSARGRALTPACLYFR